MSADRQHDQAAATTLRTKGGPHGAWEIYDTRTGETVEAGYSEKEAHNSLAWAWNTGGDIAYLGVRHTATSRRSRGRR
jgi:hypothetical protein